MCKSDWVKEAPRLVGNRLALAGTVLYFLEWVAIAFLPQMGDGLLLGESADAVLDAYRGHSGAISFAAGWFAFVLLGRVLFSAALRRALRDSGRDSLLADFAVGAMIVSVALEIASFGPTAAAGWVADTQAEGTSVMALDAAGSMMFQMVFIPLMVSVFAASTAMWVSKLFRRWLSGLGLVAGVIGIVGGIIQVAAIGETGMLIDAGAGLTNAGVLGFWIWMIATSVVLFRRTSRRAVEAA
jgi:hypothetical protein